MEIFKQQTSFFKRSFFTGGDNLHQHVFNGENGSETVHVEYKLRNVQNFERKKSRSHQAGGHPEFKSHQTLGGFVLMRPQAVLVFHHLTIQFIDQIIHRGIQV